MNGSFNLNGDMPDVTKGKVLAKYISGNYLGMLVKNVPCIAASQMTLPFSLSFPYVFVLADTNSSGPAYFVTLEKGVTDESFLCLFNRQGEHQNLGSNPGWNTEKGFLEKAIDLVEKEFNIQLKQVGGKNESIEEEPHIEAEYKSEGFFRRWNILIYCLAIFFGLLLIGILKDNPIYLKWKDPQKYWAEEVNDAEGLVEFYNNDLSWCKLELKKIVDNRAISIKQYMLEGMSREQAVELLKKEMNDTKELCNFTRESLNEAKTDLEFAKKELNKLN